MARAIATRVLTAWFPKKEGRGYDRIVVHPVSGHYEVAVKVLFVLMTGLGGVFFLLGLLAWVAAQLRYIDTNALDLSFSSAVAAVGSGSGEFALAAMSTGALVFSLAFLAMQIEEGRKTRLRQDMPVVTVAPRLLWELVGIDSATKEIVVRNLRLQLRVDNVGNSPATRVLIRCRAARYIDSAGVDQPVGIWRDQEVTLDALSPTPLDGSGDDTRFRATLEEALPECAGNVVADVLRTDDRYPALILEFTVSFETIRTLAFKAKAQAVWSPRACRRVGGSEQRQFLRMARSVGGAEGAGLRDLRTLAAENPFAPLILGEHARLS